MVAVHSKKEEKLDKILSIAIPVIVILGLIIAYAISNNLFSTKDHIYLYESAENVEKTDNITAPGFKDISFSKDSKKQSVNLYNPASNNCSFKMSILLSDGTVVWSADELLMPGYGFDTIHLEKALGAGIYPDSMLCYTCYDNDGHQLNGSIITLTIHGN